MQFKCLFLTITVLLSFSRPTLGQHPLHLDHGGTVHTVAFSPVDASLFASGGANRVIKLWDLQTARVVSTLRGHTDTVNAVAFSPNGELLASGGDDWTFRLWNISSQQNIATLEHIADLSPFQVKAVAFSPDGQLLATAGMHVKIWEVSNLTELATLQHNEYVWALAFSPNGQLLAAGDGGGIVKIWAVQKREAIAQLEGDTTSVYSVTFSGDGRTLASAGYQGHIKLWAVQNWELFGTLQNNWTVYSVDFSPDSKVLANTGRDTVNLWSVESGEKITSLRGHVGWLRRAAFSPDGTTLASGGEDFIVRVQNIDPYLQTLRQREMVRLIYFLPQDRRFQQDIDIKMDTLIKDTQYFFGEQMINYGFDRKTFTFETDVHGKAVVHRVTGEFADWYYHYDTLDKVMAEIDERFDDSKHINLIAIDIGNELIGTQWCGRGGFHGSGGGRAIIPASGSCFAVDTTAHELGHALGLEHDFRSDAYLMSYGGFSSRRLSRCAAEWLEVSRFFNAGQNAFNEHATIQMLSPLASPPNSTNLRFEIADTDGLHQAQLIIPTAAGDPADGVKLHGCKALNGEMSLIDFITTDLTAISGYEVKLRVIDVHGNFEQRTYQIEVDDVARVDVNGDGIIDVVDLMLVASFYGQSRAPGTPFASDVNSDGVVDVNDILLVVAALESSTSGAPAAHSKTFAAPLARWIGEVRQYNPGDNTFKKGLAVLEELLAALRPTATVLLANYPNPFNPETWIPYHLATDADVQITIYDTEGRLVRRLDLGHQLAGYYTARSKAAYWDGRNASGAPVASGVYFYQLRVGRSGLSMPHQRDYTATRRMVIVK